MWKIYVRLKVLTEKGKENANVELRQYQETGLRRLFSGYTVGDIQGRTIHSDGTIIPFTGKPYEKVVDKDAYHKEDVEGFHAAGCAGRKHHRISLSPCVMTMTSLIPPSWIHSVRTLYTQGTLYLETNG